MYHISTAHHMASVDGHVGWQCISWLLQAEQQWTWMFSVDRHKVSPQDDMKSMAVYAQGPCSWAILHTHFLLLRELHTSYHSDWSSSHSHNSVEGFPLPHILTGTCAYFFSWQRSFLLYLELSVSPNIPSPLLTQSILLILLLSFTVTP